MKFKKLSYMVVVLVMGVISSATAQTYSYQYNESNQLIEVKHSDCTVISYTYDDNGNRTERIVLPCPKISGYVLTPEDFGITGVVLNGLPGNPSTDSAGFYSVHVEPGWSGTVMPEKTDYTFDPVERSYVKPTADQPDQNYIGVLPHYTLTVETSGSGSVTGDGGIDCPSLCTQTFDKGTKVILSAAPDPGFLFIGWSGAGCSGTGDCEVTILADTLITANFIPDPTIEPTPTETPKPTPTPSGTPTEPIPEPGTLLYFVIGLLGLLGPGLRRWKKRK